MTQIFLGLFALAVTALYAWGISLIPVMIFGDPLGPRLLPQLLAVLLGGIGCGLLVSGLRERIQWRGQWQQFLAWLRSAEPRTVLVTSVAIGLYLLAFEPLGYLLSTTIFLSALMLAAHRGRRWIALVTAIGFALGSYLLFTRIFDMLLPQGVLGF